MKSRSYALLTVFCGAIALVLLAARAAFAAGVPDPTTNPGGVLTLLYGLYSTGAYAPLAIVVAYMAAHYAEAHTVRPNLRHVIAAVVGGLTLLVVPAMNGTTANAQAIGEAVGVFVAMLLPGWTPVSKPAPQAGFVRLALLLPLAGICAGVLACDSCGAPTPVPVADLIDCVKLEAGANWLAVEAQLKPDVDAHDWSKLVTDAEAIAPKLGLEVAGCVAAELVQQYLSTKQADKSATWGARDAIEQLRAKLSPPGKSATFHTSHDYF